MANSSNTTAQDVAEFMLNKVITEHELYQADVVDDIEQNFGQQFVYENDNGNMSIDKKVLATFKKISEETVVWEKSSKSWRLREQDDDPGRQQY